MFNSCTCKSQLQRTALSSTHTVHMFPPSSLISQFSPPHRKGLLFSAQIIQLTNPICNCNHKWQILLTSSYSINRLRYMYIDSSWFVNQIENKFDFLAVNLIAWLVCIVFLEWFRIMEKLIHSWNLFLSSQYFRNRNTIIAFEFSILLKDRNRNTHTHTHIGIAF